MSTKPSRSRWHTVPTLAVLGAGLLVVGFVWVLSCIWSFSEETRAALALGFAHPHVLPWMLDALAAALALVALAAALAGQTAGLARLGVAASLAGAVWANAAGVSIRSGGDPKHDAVVMAAIAPVSAFVALEVLLGKIRRLVLWLRGEEPPAAIPHLRLIRLVLSPKTFGDWRQSVLDLTQTTPAPSSSNRPVEDTLRDADAAGPGGGTHLTPGPARDTGGVGAPADPSGLTTPGRGADPAEREAGSDAAAPGSAGHLSAVPPDTTTRTRVSAAGQGVRPLVSVRADTAPDTPAGQGPDTRPDTRPDTPPRTPGHPRPDTTTQTTGHQVSGRADQVSELLLSGHSVRAVAAATGQPRSTVQDRRTALVAAGQLPSAKGSQ